MPGKMRRLLLRAMSPQTMMLALMLSILLAASESGNACATVNNLHSSYQSPMAH